MKKTVIFELLVLLIISPSYIFSQVIINEFLASNTGSTIDPDYNESADWIELYNSGNVTVDIGGFFLTDNFENKVKWEIPAGIQIPSKGFLVIWADGFNAGMHTGFKISANGEELAFYSASGVLVDSISFGLQEPNISMGRQTDGGTTWGFFYSSNARNSQQSGNI